MGISRTFTCLVLHCWQPLRDFLCPRRGICRSSRHNGAHRALVPFCGQVVTNGVAYGQPVTPCGGVDESKNANPRWGDVQERSCRPAVGHWSNLGSAGLAICASDNKNHRPKFSSILSSRHLRRSDQCPTEQNLDTVSVADESVGENCPERYLAIWTPIFKRRTRFGCVGSAMFGSREV